MDQVRDNTAASQYELDIDGETVFARYRKAAGVLTILWVEAPPALRGSGAASRRVAPPQPGVSQPRRLTGQPTSTMSSTWISAGRPR